MIKFLNAESKSIIGAAALIGVFSFVSRMFGFIRDRVLAGTFGAGDTLDAYYAAFKIPDLLFSLLVVGAVSAAFIPIFSRFYYGGDRDSAWRFTGNVLHTVLLGMGVVALVAIIFAGPLSTLVAPGFAPHKQAVVAQFMRVMLLAQVILAASMVFGSVLQGLKRFVLYASAPVLYNVGIIVGAAWLAPKWGPIWLAWGVVFGAFLHALVQAIGCVWAGYRYTPVFAPRARELRELIKLTGPRMIGIGVSQILVLVMTVLATTMTVGSVTIFQFAYNIQFFPIGIIGVSLAVAAFPTFSEHLARNETDAFRRAFSGTVREALFFLIPLSLLFLILRAQIVRVVVGAGAFDWDATVLTANTLAFFALTFIPQSLVFICVRAFFALHDTITPLTAGLVGALVGLISGFLFRPTFGVVGLGMAYGLFAIVNLVLLWVPLRARIGSLDESRILTSLMKLLVSGIACGLIAQFVKAPLASVFSLNTFWGVLFQGGIAGVLALIGYALVAWFLRSEELIAFVASMQRRIFRRVKPTEAVVE